MLVDAKDRAALDVDEGEDQLLFGFDNSGKNEAPKDKAASNDVVGGLIDLDSMLGSTSTPQPETQINMGGISNDMMDLFGGGPTQPAPTTQAPMNNNMLGGDILGLSSQPQQP